MSASPLRLIGRGCAYCGRAADHGTDAHHDIQVALEQVHRALVKGDTLAARRWAAVAQKLAPRPCAAS
jgi:hypothetical protein